MENVKFDNFSVCQQSTHSINLAVLLFPRHLRKVRAEPGLVHRFPLPHYKLTPLLWLWLMLLLLLTVDVVVVEVPVQLPQLSSLSFPLIRLQAEEKLIQMVEINNTMNISHLRKDSNEANGAWRNL